ncbi:hydroxyisourate hydrolase [Actinocorallia sp. API 0066]|uniref:hydroxyisourate hydrolase n=1 Tax=Actinocorallia sp. API 0066 TaxID=2896846 RepID=UPI001E4D965D|nr:hydroxyisourate hydrolase [Actinocorallia sp. API 0066]MCD0451054.1 hydroxyisourate hydrolase [Actinocorallia sp. API 0066]
MSITIRVVDAVRGVPASGVPVRLDTYDGQSWQAAEEGVTDERGGIRLEATGDGPFRARLGAGQYFRTAFPEVQVIFDPSAGNRLELQLAPHTYTAAIITE